MTDSVSAHPTRNRAPSTLKKGAWSADEDPLLITLVRASAKPDWELIARHFPGKTAQQVADRWNKVVNPDIVKGSWSDEEDRQIVNWVTQNGPKNWTALAATMHGRVGKQCRERWVNSLDPDLVRQPWTEDEDRILIEHQRQWGNKWAKIAGLLPGRTDNSVKNRWNSSLKRKLERIAAGLNPVLKRGRKPKRPSAAPELPSQDTVDDIPKPDLTQAEIKIPLIQLSPILQTESPFGMLSPGGFGIRSPAFGGGFRSPAFGGGFRSPFTWRSPMDLKGGFTFNFEAAAIPFHLEGEGTEKE
jgi:hypothetical protein